MKHKLELTDSQYMALFDGLGLAIGAKAAKGLIHMDLVKLGEAIALAKEMQPVCDKIIAGQAKEIENELALSLMSAGSERAH
jgi:hypothetical protein